MGTLSADVFWESPRSVMARRFMSMPPERPSSTPVPSGGTPFQCWRNPAPDTNVDEFDSGATSPQFLTGHQTPTPGLYRSATPSPRQVPPLGTTTPTPGSSYNFQHGLPPTHQALFMDDSSRSSSSSVRPISPCLPHGRTGSTTTNSGGGSSCGLGGKNCGVCGDRAKSFHFGGLCCDSCKAFFRRSVQNDAYKNFHCSYEGRCVINMSTRKSCQYCRLQRCLAIGMEKGWIMTEQERMLMMKQRAEKKRKQEEDQKARRLQQIQQNEQLTFSQSMPSQPSPSSAPPMQQPQPQQPTPGACPMEPMTYEPDLSRMLEFLDQTEVDQIETLVKNYALAYVQVPYEEGLKCMDVQRPGVQIINMFTTLIRRFASYAVMLPDFKALPPMDQTTLLRGGTLEMCLLRGALAFDPRNHRWPNSAMEMYRNAPTLHVMDVKKLVSNDLFDKHMKFIGDVQKLQPDEPTVMLLLLIVLFTPERAQLQPQVAASVQCQQDRYSVLLKKYMNWRYGPHRAKAMYSHLLTKLCDLRELSDTHNQFHLYFANTEVSEIQKHLSVMNLNPYPTWNVLTSAPVATATTLSPNSGSTSSSALSLAFTTTAGATGRGSEESSPVFSSHSARDSPDSLVWDGSQVGMLQSDMITRHGPSPSFGDSPVLGSIPRNFFRDSGRGLNLTPTSPTSSWTSTSTYGVMGNSTSDTATSSRLFQEDWRKVSTLDWPESGPLALMGGASATTSLTDAFNAQQLEQFRIMLEQLTQCKDAQQLEQIKHVLGPELVSQFQQKMLGSPGEATSTDEEAQDVLQVAAESFYPTEFTPGERNYSVGSDMAVVLPSSSQNLQFGGRHHHAHHKHNHHHHKSRRALLASMSSSSSSSSPSPAVAGRVLQHSVYEGKLNLEADLYFPLFATETAENQEGETLGPSSVQANQHS